MTIVAENKLPGSWLTKPVYCLANNLRKHNLLLEIYTYWPVIISNVKFWKQERYEEINQKQSNSEKINFINGYTSILLRYALYVLFTTSMIKQEYIVDVLNFNFDWKNWWLIHSSQELWVFIRLNFHLLYIRKNLFLRKHETNKHVVTSIIHEGLELYKVEKEVDL